MNWGSVNCRAICNPPAAPGKCRFHRERMKSQSTVQKWLRFKRKLSSSRTVQHYARMEAGISGNRIWKATASVPTGDLSSGTESGPVLRDHSNAYWNTRSWMHANLSIPCKIKPQLNYKTSFALLGQIEIELRSNSKANRVLYLENLVTLYRDVKMITMWWHCGDSWCTREQSVYTGAEMTTIMKKNTGNITTLRNFLHWKIVCYNTVR